MTWTCPHCGATNPARQPVCSGCLQEREDETGDGAVYVIELKGE